MAGLLRSNNLEFSKRNLRKPLEEGGRGKRLLTKKFNP
jgi:hypothetical protein